MPRETQREKTYTPHRALLCIWRQRRKEIRHTGAQGQWSLQGWGGRPEEGLRVVVRVDVRQIAPEHWGTQLRLLGGTPWLGGELGGTPRVCPEKTGWVVGTCESPAQVASPQRGGRVLTKHAIGALPSWLGVLWPDSLVRNGTKKRERA